MKKKSTYPKTSKSPNPLAQIPLPKKETPRHASLRSQKKANAKRHQMKKTELPSLEREPSQAKPALPICL